MTCSIDKRNNCFNLIRLYACLNVLFYHMYLHMDVKTPIITSLVNPINGVPVFFLLSGFLIWMSLERNDKFKPFFTKRILRLYPELWFSMLIEIILLLCLFEGATVLDYMRLILFQGLIYPPYAPKVFDAYGMGFLNLALWTIPVILQFYLLIWVLYPWLKKKSKSVWIIVLLVSIIIAALLNANVHKSFPLPLKFIIRISVGYHLWIFLIGSFIAKFFDDFIPILMKYWYIPFMAFIAYEAIPIPVKPIVTYSLSGVVLLALFMFSFAYKFPMLTVTKDISYAVYLNHLVFTNAFIQLGYKGNGLAVFLIVMLTLLYSYISTVFISRILKK